MPQHNRATAREIGADTYAHLPHTSPTLAYLNTACSHLSGYTVPVRPIWPRCPLSDTSQPSKAVRNPDELFPTDFCGRFDDIGCEVVAGDIFCAVRLATSHLTPPHARPIHSCSPTQQRSIRPFAPPQPYATNCAACAPALPSCALPNVPHSPYTSVVEHPRSSTTTRIL